MIHKYEDGITRCDFRTTEAIYLDYHDSEWGVPLTGDQELFEQISLEGFQAGLSWITILKRREGFRKAFKNFDLKKVAKMTDLDVEKLMVNDGIIRNRSKIISTINNANLVLEMNKNGESLSDLMWHFAPAPSKRVSPAKNFSWLAVTPASTAMSKELKSRGFGFVGPTTMHALMQSTGMINDHAPGCFRRKALS